MKPVRTILASTAFAALLGTAAVAHGTHSGAGADTPAGPGMTREDGGMMMPGMQQMMRMHRKMMGGMGPGMMGGMMGGMGPLLHGLDADADGDGMVTPEEMHARLQELLTEHDADGDGALSLEEFAALHAALLREAMVDRFQFLDDDGDGRVTQEEIVKPADMMARMQTMMRRMRERSGAGMGPAARPGGGHGMDGDGMMDDEGMEQTPGRGMMNGEGMMSGRGKGMMDDN